MKYLFYKVRTEDIYPIKFIVEGFENWMTVSTIDEVHSKIQITIAPDFLAECQTILEDLSNRYLMIPLDEPIDKSQGNY